MNNSQVLNTVLIVVGAGILIYTLTGEEVSPYFKILGLVIIMFGLYRATNFWVATKDDHEQDAENKSDRP
ncbi:hypothetical protein E0K83_06775 [Gramella sp. BOM4]|nr:hypothetical protein [Christiangramia bathymodioli]